MSGPIPRVFLSFKQKLFSLPNQTLEMTLRLAVIGANGKVATKLMKRLAQLKNEFDTVAFIRNEAQAPKFTKLGIKYSTEIDLTNTPVEGITEALRGFDAIVFSAGAGGKGLDLTFSVDLDGAIKVKESIENNNSNQRLILVSAIKAKDRSYWWDTDLRSYYIAKKYADQIIESSDINYTILQPGYLLDTDATGKIADPKKVNNYADTVKGQHEKISIPRDDVALTIIESLRNKNTNRKVIPLISGDIPISEALKNL